LASSLAISQINIAIADISFLHLDYFSLHCHYFFYFSYIRHYFLCHWFSIHYIFMIISRHYFLRHFRTPLHWFYFFIISISLHFHYIIAIDISSFWYLFLSHLLIFLLYYFFTLFIWLLHWHCRTPAFISDACYDDISPFTPLIGFIIFISWLLSAIHYIFSLLLICLLLSLIFLFRFLSIIISIHWYFQIIYFITLHWLFQPLRHIDITSIYFFHFIYSDYFFIRFDVISFSLINNITSIIFDITVFITF